MKKVVLQLWLNDEQSKQKVMKCVSGVTGVVSITVDMKENKLTVTGNIDPFTLESKLRKICDTQTVSVVELEPPKDDPKKGDNIKRMNDFKVGGKPLAPHFRKPPYKGNAGRVVKNNNPNACTIS